MDRHYVCWIYHYDFDDADTSIWSASIFFVYMFSLVVLILGNEYFSIAGQGPAAIQSYVEQHPHIREKLLITLLLLTPLFFACWFAPTLIVLNNMPLFDALKLSFRACLINIIPFMLYKLILLILFSVAVIPFFLGLLILWPVFIASTYVSYKSIFFTEASVYEA